VAWVPFCKTQGKLLLQLETRTSNSLPVMGAPVETNYKLYSISPLRHDTEIFSYSAAGWGVNQQVQTTYTFYTFTHKKKGKPPTSCIRLWARQVYLSPAGHSYFFFFFFFTGISGKDKPASLLAISISSLPHFPKVDRFLILPRISVTDFAVSPFSLFSLGHWRPNSKGQNKANGSFALSRIKKNVGLISDDERGINSKTQLGK
jgi:hypothetical protein